MLEKRRSLSGRGSATAKAPLLGRLSPAMVPLEASQLVTSSAPERRSSVRGSATAIAPFVGACWPVMACDGSDHGTVRDTVWNISACARGSATAIPPAVGPVPPVTAGAGAPQGTIRKQLLCLAGPRWRGSATEKWPLPAAALPVTAWDVSCQPFTPYW